MVRGLFLTIIAIMVVVTTNLYSQNSCNPEDEIITPEYDYHVWYSNDDPTNKLCYIEDAKANQVSDALKLYHEQYKALGFGDPKFYNNSRLIYIQDIRDSEDENIPDPKEIGRSNLGRITLDPDNLKGSNEDCLKVVTGHELFHHFQYSYCPNIQAKNNSCGGSYGK